MLRIVLATAALILPTLVMAQENDVVIDDGPIGLSAEHFTDTVSTNAPAGAKGLIVRVKKEAEGDFSKAEFRFTTAEKNASTNVAELWKATDGQETEVTGSYYYSRRHFRVYYYSYVYYVPVYYFTPVYYGPRYVYYTYYW